ncbi:MAG: hypothetical protein M3232_00915 [Thermoproteota archaeon]|nr:hypothetical protein [Thermoproteota archaeon]
MSDSDMSITIIDADDDDDSIDLSTFVPIGLIIDQDIYQSMADNVHLLSALIRESYTKYLLKRLSQFP